ncbi:MAG: hypothetical protein MUF86_07000 [Akkermansiaceae bacterium]|nr:hypothetical protein [Akkermansiaceae bacterium]MCU0777401.1 hypothetical protein [Akkermansiaceae bacterium]
MKTSCALVMLGFLTAPSHAGVEIPRSVYQTAQLEAARAEAAEKNKALAFVMSDPGTTCGLCVAATDMAFEKLKSHSVVVFINSEDDNKWADVGPMVVTGISEKKMGNLIPRAVITSPDMSEIWGQMKYEELKVEGPYRGIKKQVDAILKGEAKPENPPERPIYWPIKGSKEFYIGAFVDLADNGGLRLKMESNGKMATIPLGRLTGNCAVLARTLAGREPEAKPQPEASQAPALESWTGSNGKTLQARFVSLADDKVTLEMEDGKTYTMPLERLAGSSRERAKTLQAAKQP